MKQVYMNTDYKFKYHVSTGNFQYNRNSSKSIADKNKVYTET